MTFRRLLRPLLTGSALLATAALADIAPDAPSDPSRSTSADPTVAPSIPPQPIGAPLPGLTPEELSLFYEGKALFEHTFTPQEGLGPVFNGPSCATCHSNPVTAGSDPTTYNNVHHITLEWDGNTYLAFELGGPVRQAKSITGMPGADPACVVAPEKDPTIPAGRVSLRHTPPLFGLGLLDAVTDEQIIAMAGSTEAKHYGVIGTPNWGVELEGLGSLLAFHLDNTPRTQPTGASRVGRFGWKAPVSTLFQFTTEPFNIELGVSTPFFPRENMPDGSLVPDACKIPNAQPNDAQSQKSLRLFYFQAFLAPPARGPVTQDALQGEILFGQLGCTDCHVKRLTTAPDYYVPGTDGRPHRVAALSNKTVEPYTDLLIHDMGPDLGDHRPQGLASGRFWRTTPLWGFRYKTRYLHDGSAATPEEAILAHHGEGQISTQAYLLTSSVDRARLNAFLNSL